MHGDLREFIAAIESADTLRRIAGAAPLIEIGAITEVAAGLPGCPALLFDELPGFPPGIRVLTNAMTTPRRAALALGLDPALGPIDLLRAWMARRQTLVPLPPVAAADAPLLDHSFRGADVDLARLAAPTWHAKDGGPYIGSGSIVVMRDPDDGSINASIYRVQVHGPARVTVQFDHEGRHGAMLARKYWSRGEPCPLAVVNGIEPSLFVAGFEYLPLGVSEYAFAGAIRGAPIEVVAGPVTSLPLPARAESALEGVLLPTSQTTLPEGPFGEFTGYYASEARPCAVMEVTALHHRTDPILLGSPPMKPPRFHFGLPFRAAGLWSQLEAAGVTDVAGVWQHVSQLMTVVAVRQRYDGHAKRAGLLAAANSYMGRFVVVVDDDVDPSNLEDVMWAVATRCEPSEQIDIVREAWSSALDPRIPPEAKAGGTTSHSKAIILACRPFSWMSRFPPTSALTPDEVRAIERKWGSAMRGIRT